MGLFDDRSAKRAAKYERMGAEVWERQQEAQRQQDELRDTNRGAVLVTSKATYVGGLGGQIDPGSYVQLWVDDDGFRLTNMYATDELPWTEIAAVLVNSGEVAKSRAAAVLAFGVLGLGAKASETVAEVALHLHDGRLVAFMTVDESAVAIRTRLAPVVAAAGLRIDRPVSPESSTGASGSFVDELERLATLHERGVLSLEELDAAKRKLLE
jgi:hypothetical protein